MTDVLSAENISKSYGGVSALKNVSFAVRPGEVHALMGENGAGKSTLIKILAGAAKPDAGRILLNGQPVSIHNALDSQRLGIGIVYQELDLFPNLTVGENIVIRNLNFPERSIVNFRRIDSFCRPFLEQVGFAASTRAITSSLPIGQLQLIALARALSMNARVILMDEPTSSLAEDGAARLLDLVRKLRDTGIGIVYVSHKMDEVFSVCDRATVLRDGETIAVEEIQSTTSDTLIRMMVGRDLDKRERSASSLGANVLLSVRGLSTKKLRDISFDLHEGEVLGVAGLVGAGRSELGAALFGLDRPETGEIRIKGRKADLRSPAAAISQGIGLLPEDRKLQGLMMQMSVLENSSLSVIGRMQRFGFINRQQEREAVEPIYQQLRLKSASRSSSVSALSGGNQQKALLARWLMIDPDVLFLDDPARGIDVGAKQDIYRIIATLAAAKKGLILVSSELPELLNCCDRILVLSDGRLAGDFTASQASQEAIMAAAISTQPGGTG
jgi:ABC-type sugar transport system ATPase subunit